MYVVYFPYILEFSGYISVTDFWFTSVIVHKHTLYNFILLKLLRFVLWSRIEYLVVMFSVHYRRMCRVFCKYQLDKVGWQHCSSHYILNIPPTSIIYREKNIDVFNSNYEVVYFIFQFSQFLHYVFQNFVVKYIPT